MKLGWGALTKVLLELQGDADGRITIILWYNNNTDYAIVVA